MMNSDETPRGMPYQQGRKPIPSKYQDNRYSPSSNYNYNSNNSFPSSQHPRRRFDRFKRDPTGNSNNNDRLMRQNDLIIRLLKEIRDRLPPPAVSASYNGGGDAEAARQNGPGEGMERADAPRIERREPVPETGNSGMPANSIGEPLQTEPQPQPEANRDGE
jgi:hypothetical protein